MNQGGEPCGVAVNWQFLTHADGAFHLLRPRSIIPVLLMNSPRHRESFQSPEVTEPGVQPGQFVAGGPALHHAPRLLPPQTLSLSQWSCPYSGAGGLRFVRGTHGLVEQS